MAITEPAPRLTLAHPLSAVAETVSSAHGGTATIALSVGVGLGQMLGAGSAIGHIFGPSGVNELEIKYFGAEAAGAGKGRTMQSESRSPKIAVTGATGRVGSHLVEILEQRGHDVVPIARSEGVDVVSGEGLDAALAGAETIIDTATGPSPDQEEATAFFTASARNLQRAGAQAGARRIVAVSIIGIDKFQGGYNAAKVAQE